MKSQRLAYIAIFALLTSFTLDSCAKNYDIEKLPDAVYTDEILGRSILILNGNVIFEEKDLAKYDYEQYISNGNKKLTFQKKNERPYVRNKDGRCLNRGVVSIFISNDFFSNEIIQCGGYVFKPDKCNQERNSKPNNDCQSTRSYSVYCDSIVNGACMNFDMAKLDAKTPFMKYVFEKNFGVTQITIFNREGRREDQYKLTDGVPIR